MSEFLEIALVIAIVVYVVGRQLIGEPLRGKRVVVLPVILTLIGASDLGSKHVPIQSVDVVCLVIGGAITAAIGLALGATTRLESRDGALWGQLPVRGLWLWLLLIVSRLLTTVVADGLNAKVAAASSTILLMLGINRLAQAAVIVLRATASGIPFAPEKDGRQLLSGLTTPSATRSSTPPGQNAQPAAGTDWQALAGQATTYLANHHRDHRERHDRNDH